MSLADHKCAQREKLAAEPIIREMKWNAINLRHGNGLTSREAFFPGKSNEALQSETREVICNWFTEDAYLPHVVCTVPSLALLVD